MRVVGISSNEGSQESAFYSNSNRGRGRGDTEARMVDIINMKVSLMEVDEDTLEEEEVVSHTDIAMVNSLNF
jgi:hypothetical protein